MNKTTHTNMAASALSNLPVIKNLPKLLKSDDVAIDNAVFKFHKQGSIYILMIGIMFIFVENHIDSKAIVCDGADQYALSYCWIHGSSYIGNHLQGKVTGCIVDQSKIEEDAPVTTYYLWIPFLLTLCVTLARAPSFIWSHIFENGLLRNITENKQDPKSVAQRFIQFRHRYLKYHIYFGICEFLNMIMVIISMVITDMLLSKKFMSYGKDVIEYISSSKQNYAKDMWLNDPMCEVFPTEVACKVNMGSVAGAWTSKSYLCILTNNIFNQKYFFILWIWWITLICISVVGLVFRVARISFPGLSRHILMTHVHASKLQKAYLSDSDCFMLDMISQNMSHSDFDSTLDNIEEIVSIGDCTETLL